MGSVNVAYTAQRKSVFNVRLLNFFKNAEYALPINFDSLSSLDIEIKRILNHCSVVAY